MYHQLFFMTNCFFCFLFIFAGFTVVVADDNKLTASLCNTCPAICDSAPPSNSKPPPLITPAVKSTPPPPPTPAALSHAPPPPRFYYFDSPAVAPPAYISSGGNGAAPPPPRLVYLPSTETPPGGGVSGQTNYPYPYYMYDSKAANAFSIGFLLLLLVSFHVTLLVLV